MISVCIATYNGEKYLREQLDSILCQLDINDEVIISDDSSTDNTLEIIRSYKDNRIRILSHNKFFSPVFNFENALKHVKGDYIFLSDQDDIWMENKVEIMMGYLKQGYSLVLSDGLIVDKDLKICSDSIYEILNSHKGFVQNLIHNSYSGSRMAFTRSLLDVALPFPSHIAMHDIWIGLCSELFMKTIYIPDKLILYRRHENNVSMTGEKSPFGFGYKLSYRFYLLCHLIKRWKKLKNTKFL